MEKKRTCIGKVSATEKTPSSCDEFYFWLKDDIKLSPFDVVCVDNKSDESITYGVVQDIFHITDGTGHISNYVSSDFGDVYSTPMTQRLALSFAKVSVVWNSSENYMPVFEGSLVYSADEHDISIALGLDTIPEQRSIPAGIMRSGDGISVPVFFNADFLIGPEGAHMNVSGISGLATKTSYVMFLLRAIQEKYRDEVAIVILNVKGDDLLQIDEPNQRITEVQKREWANLGIECSPFENVRYCYPYIQRSSTRNRCSDTALSDDELREQFSKRRAVNYVYTFDHDITKVDMLFANVDDPNWTIESILNYIETSSEFSGDMSWNQFKEKLQRNVEKGAFATRSNKDIPVQSWRRFSRLIRNTIENDLFVDELSNNKELQHVHLSDVIQGISAGEVLVVDIAKLTEQLQCLVFGDVMRSVYELKHGDYDASLREQSGPVPKKNNYLR